MPLVSTGYTEELHEVKACFEEQPESESEWEAPPLSATERLMLVADEEYKRLQEARDSDDLDYEALKAAHVPAHLVVAAQDAAATAEQEAEM